MTGNKFYDPDTNSTFVYAPDPSSQQPHYWTRAEPIWVTAEKQGLRTAMFWWDGCRVNITGWTGSHCLDYGVDQQFHFWDPETYEHDYINATNEIMSAFAANQWQLAMVYYEGMDGAGHMYGTNSTVIDEYIQKLDNVVSNIIDSTIRLQLEDQVNVVIVSDHGMIDVGPTFGTKVIHLSQFLNKSDAHYLGGGGPFVLVWPSQGVTDLELYRKLTIRPSTGMNVYLKKDIPSKYHFKKSDRIAPILLVAKRGEICSYREIHDDGNFL